MADKFVFFGNPFFASYILEFLIKSGFVPSLVVTNKDKPVGRKKIITPTPVKEVALKYNLHTYEPDKVSLEDFKSFYRGETFGVLAAYGKIIPLSVIHLFKKGIVAVHPSLLPKYRGPTPIQSVILGGDKETGTTIFLLDEKVDHGPILAQEKMFLDENITFVELQQKLAYLSAQLLVKTITLFLEDKITPIPQDDRLATYTRKFSMEDAFVPYEDLIMAIEGSSEKAVEILRKIRALNPEPGVWTIMDNVRTKLLAASIENGKLKLIKIQKAGKLPIVFK